MKIKIESYNLGTALSAIEKGISTTKVRPTDGFIFFELFEGRNLRITALGEALISVMEEVESDSDSYEFCVEGKLFISFVKKCTDTIILNITDNKIELASGSIKSKFAIGSALAPAVPPISSLFEHDVLTISAKDFANATEKTLFCVSPVNLRPILQGLNFKCNANENHFVVCGTDGYRLSISKFDSESTSKSLIDITFLSKSVSLLNSISNILNADNMKLVFINSRSVVFIIKNAIVKIPLFSESYVDYKRILPHNPGTVYFKADELKKTLEIAKLVANVVKISFERDSMVISSCSQLSDCEVEVSKTNIECCECISDGFCIGLNATFLLDALKTIDVEEVKMTFSTSNCSAFTVECNNTYNMILPVRLPE